MFALKLAEDSDTSKSEDLCKKTPEGHADVARFLMVQGKGVWWSPQSRSLHWF
jgi:hypothetical protein